MQTYSRSYQHDDDADCQRMADLLNAAFGRTFHTAGELRRFHPSPSYRSDLDIVIEAPDGTLGFTDVDIDHAWRKVW